MTAKDFADELERRMSIMWALAPDREAQREQDRSTGVWLVKKQAELLTVLRKACAPTEALTTIKNGGGTAAWLIINGEKVYIEPGGSFVVSPLGEPKP